MNSLAIQTYGAGSPVVLFHGWGFDSHIWDTLIPDLLELPHAYQIILVDLPGFGQSPLLSWSDFKQQLFAAVPRPFSVLAWSLGGLFATRLAKEAPDKIKKLLLVASTPYFMQAPNWVGIAPETLNDFYQQLISTPQITRQQFIRSQLPADMYAEETPLAPVDSKLFLGLHEGLLILKHWDLRRYLSQLTMPVAYLFGRLDRIVSHKTLGILQDTFPQFHYSLLPHAGHMPFLSHRTGFIHWFKEHA